MPPLPDVPKVVRVDLTFVIGEDLGAKVRFFKRYAGVAPSAGDLVEFAADIRELWTSSGLKAHTCDTDFLHSVECTDLSSPTSAYGIDTTSVQGTESDSALPASACLVVSHKVGRRFRGGHARNYWHIGAYNDLADPQKFNPGFVTALQTDMDAFYGGINSEGWTSAGTIDSVAVSYYEGFTVFTGTTGRARNISTVRVTPVIDTVLSHTVRAGVGSQRGRLLHLA